ncbi:MAG: ArnT family glycosyltransferase [Planctomycetaceae bacterium]
MVLQYQLDHVWHRDFLIPGDAEGYWELGKKIAAGEEYAVYDPPRKVLRMPGFPLVLAGAVSLFGESLFAARLVLAFVGTLACGAVYLLGKELFHESAGLFGAVLAAVMPTFVLFSVIVLSETTFTICMILNLWAFAVLIRKARAGETLRTKLSWSVLCGVLIAAGTYVRPNWILVGPLFPAVWWITEKFQKRAAVQGLVMFAAFVACMAPWTWRNYLVTEKFVPTTLWMGPSLYDGLNPQATGESEMSFFDRDGLSAQMTEYEVDRHYRQAAWSFARENPLKSMQLAWQKFLRFWKPWPNAGDFRNPLAIVATLAGFVLLIGSATAGAWSLRHQYWMLTLLVGPVIYFCLMHLFFVSSLRYRLPGEYALCLLAAAFWTGSRNRTNDTDKVDVPVTRTPSFP